MGMRSSGTVDSPSRTVAFFGAMFLSSSSSSALDAASSASEASAASLSGLADAEGSADEASSLALPPNLPRKPLRRSELNQRRAVTAKGKVLPFMVGAGSLDSSVRITTALVTDTTFDSLSSIVTLIVAFAMASSVRLTSAAVRPVMVVSNRSVGRCASLCPVSAERAQQKKRTRRPGVRSQSGAQSRLAS